MGELCQPACLNCLPPTRPTSPPSHYLSLLPSQAPGIHPPAVSSPLLLLIHDASSHLYFSMNVFITLLLLPNQSSRLAFSVTVESKYIIPHWINVRHLHERESHKASKYILVCTQNHTLKAVPISPSVWVLKMALAEKA